MIHMSTKSFIALLNHCGAAAVMEHMSRAELAEMAEHRDDAVHDTAVLDLENNEMRLAAQELHVTYRDLQEYAGSLEEENKSLREQIDSMKHGLPVSLIRSSGVAHLITTMTAGAGRAAIGAAVLRLLPELSMSDAVKLAEDAVSNASRIITVEPEQRSQTIPIGSADDISSEVPTIPKITSVKVAYPEGGASVG